MGPFASAADPLRDVIFHFSGHHITYVPTRRFVAAPTCMSANQLTRDSRIKNAHGITPSVGFFERASRELQPVLFRHIGSTTRLLPCVAQFDGAGPTMPCPAPPTRHRHHCRGPPSR